MIPLFDWLRGLYVLEDMKDRSDAARMLEERVKQIPGMIDVSVSDGEIDGTMKIKYRLTPVPARIDIEL